MTKPVRIEWKSLFNAIDSMDANTFASFLTEDSVFRFGNAKPVRGRNNVKEAVAGFFSSIRALKHDVLGIWESDDVVTIQGEVSYTKKDGGVVTVPFVDLLRLNRSLIQEYLIYIDASPLYS